MYLRETKQKRVGGQIITHLQLAESVWNPEKKRSETKVIFNCGRADDPEMAERLRRLARSILRRVCPEAIVAEEPGWRLIDAWPYGDTYILEHLWNRVGIAEVIAEQVGRRKFDFPVERALFAMVANRACAPSSKWYGLEQWLQEEVHLSKPVIDQARVREQKRLDGKFVVHSNDDTLQAEDLAFGYKQLQRVEEAWRTLKSGLRLRPVYHYAPHRIHTCLSS